MMRSRVVSAALAFPGAYEDFRWGEQVAKVNGKVFAFFGTENGTTCGMAVKLADSQEFSRSFPSVSPCGYGLARTGWAQIDFGHPECPEIGLLLDWLDESYRAIAPKRLSAQLD